MSLTILALLLAASQQNENGRTEPPGKPARPGPWTLEGKAGGGFLYDSNLWLLDGNQQDRLEANRPSDQASGRFKDMESVDDLAVTPDLRLEARGPGLLGRKADAWLDLEYPLYTQNPRRSHLELGLGVDQAIGSRGHLGLSLAFIPQYFRKNYLSDAVDADGDGDIDADERRYEDGTYREFEPELEYRHKLLDRTAQQPIGLTGTLAAGWRDRSYDSPFDGRSEEALFAKLGFRVEGGSRVKARIHYKYEAIDSPAGPEVLLLDEVALGRNVNGDAFITNDARTVTPVDRTRTEQTIGLAFGYEISPTVEFEFGWSRLFRDYDSSEPLDLDHAGRSDERDEITLLLRVRFSKGWDGRVGYEWREQHTDRPRDPGSTADATDYKRSLFLVSAVYRW